MAAAAARYRVVTTGPATSIGVKVMAELKQCAIKAYSVVDCNSTRPLTMWYIQLHALGALQKETITSTHGYEGGWALFRLHTAANRKCLPCPGIEHLSHSP